VGDFVKIDEQTQGTVEAIGLRSTRIRTLDRTLVSVPNGVLAGVRIESFTARDRVRLNCALSLEYGASAAQVRDALARIEGLLRAHPKIWPDDMTVALRQFGPSSLDVEVIAWFNVSWAEYKGEMRSELLLRIMEAVEQAGCALAYPTQKLHLTRGRA
jgi:MscS family membrane protein